MIIGIISTFEQRQEGKASDGQVAGIKMTRCVIAMLLPSHCSALFPTDNLHCIFITLPAANCLKGQFQEFDKTVFSISIVEVFIPAKQYV